MLTAESIISRRVVVGFPEQRLGYLAESVRKIGAEYCVVLEPGSTRLLGLVTFSDLAGYPEIATRILIDLMSAAPKLQLPRDASIQEVRTLFEREGMQEIAVLSPVDGAFVGLITPESFCRYLLSTAKPGAKS